ncbi:MAG: transglutaminase-like domain-containing protein [Flavobacteriales bacterium]|nr:transglutaminase-like domain-containing protein [Flavobacteriales bacterium]
MNKKEKQALIGLLDDTDEEIYSYVRNHIISLGKDIIPDLEDTWSHSFNNLLQERIEEVIHKIQFDSLCTKLADWKQMESDNLLRGALLIDRYQYPELDEAVFQKTIYQLKKDLSLELLHTQAPIEKIKTINLVLFDIHRFTNNKANFHSPQNNFISQVVESKRGNPLTLGILYITLAQSIGIPVYGVNLPEHFVLAYTNRPFDGTAFMHDYSPESEVLFYINPFSQGTIFSKREIDAYLSQLNINPRPEFYKPCQPSEILIRLLNSLIFSFGQLGYQEKIDEIYTLKKIISGDE